MADRAPEPTYKRGPCVQCGARTEKQAETTCTQSLGIDDEYHCAGQFDRFGWSIRETPESLKALDDWCSLELRSAALKEAEGRDE